MNNATTRSTYAMGVSGTVFAALTTYVGIIALVATLFHLWRKYGATRSRGDVYELEAFGLRVRKVTVTCAGYRSE